MGYRESVAILRVANGIVALALGIELLYRFWWMGAILFVANAAMAVFGPPSRKDTLDV